MTDEIHYLKEQNKTLKAQLARSSRGGSVQALTGRQGTPAIVNAFIHTLNYCLEKEKTIVPHACFQEILDTARLFSALIRYLNGPHMPGLNF